MKTIYLFFYKKQRPSMANSNKSPLEEKCVSKKPFRTELCGNVKEPGGTLGLVLQCQSYV